MWLYMGVQHNVDLHGVSTQGGFTLGFNKRWIYRGFNTKWIYMGFNTR